MVQLVLSTLLVFTLFSYGQDAVDEERFAADSLRYRTALHYDPLLDTPLESLVKLYVSAERADELIALYRNHVEQYPEDAGAKTVLIRILRRIDRAAADELIVSAAPLHPDYAPLQYVLFRFLEERGDPRAIETLSRAIDLETSATRRYEWLDQLLRLSEGEGERALAKVHFDKLLAPQDLTAESLLSLARLMQRHQFWESSIEALNRIRVIENDPDTILEVEMLLAVALNHTGKHTEAGAILTALLSRLAPGYWRRAEVLSLRLEVVATPEERLALIKSFETAFRKAPNNESAALDYAEVLVASERREEAVAVLIEASEALPKSTLLETRALELLEETKSTEVYARFLTERLEREPTRLDLRFRLVKAQYALGEDAAAEQDFKAVTAGLSPEEVSGRILDLQRYLRSIDRLDAAASYLENYVRNHPARLDVARELAEIRLTQGKGELVAELVKWLNPEEAEVENVLDFSEFLYQNDLVAAARTVVEAKLAVEPRQFDLAVELIVILGKLGDAASVQERIASCREIADTIPRYSKWLEASIYAHRSLETLPGFFETELNRYDFDSGQWTAEKIDKFLILCETGKKQLFSKRVADGLRRQLAQQGIDPALRLRLRKVLVAVLEEDPGAAAEVEEQLRLLTNEDHANRYEYDLRRVLIYHRNQRVDLAQSLVSTVALDEVTDAALLREITDLLISYNNLREAESALATVNRLEPSDLLSWERRLSLLAALEREATLRAVIRGLKAEDFTVTLRKLSLQALDKHLDASYWRSIAKLLRSPATRLPEVLPLLMSVEREVSGGNSGLWIEWTRAYVLTKIGLFEEAEEAVKRFQAAAAEKALDRVRFPDGLELSVEGAESWLAARRKDVSDDAGTVSAEFLLGGARMDWVFQLPDGVSVERMAMSDEALLVYDDANYVQAIGSTSGKLLWRRYFGPREKHQQYPIPRVFADLADPALRSFRESVDGTMSTISPPLAAAGTRFFLAQEDTFGAYSASDGSTLWTAKFPKSESKGATRAEGAAPGILFRISGERVIVFDAEHSTLRGFELETGKLLWKTDLVDAEEPREVGPVATHALNTGLSVSGDLALVYGNESAIVDLNTGQVVWRLDAALPPLFPAVLRPQREGDELPNEVTSATTQPVFNETLSLYDFEAETGVGSVSITNFLDKPSTLVSPALYWSIARGWRKEAALGILTPGSLWLLQGDKCRQISSDLPVASHEMAASGTYIGNVGPHFWFLDKNVLRHVDFTRQTSHFLPLSDLGPMAYLRATLVGNHILVRGDTSIMLVNALTGQPLGRATFPKALVDYLANASIDVAADLESSWQGSIVKDARHPSGICRPISDLVTETHYYTSFGNSHIICLEKAASATPAPPPAPTGQ